MNDLELIRSFRSDVRDPDEERVAAARQKLLAEYRKTSISRRRRRRARLALLPAPAIAAVALLLLLSGWIGGGSSDLAGAAIIHRADAALALPPHEILHTKVAGQGFVAEWWQLTSPPYSFVGDKGPVGAAPEQAADATTASYYDPSSNAIHQMPSATPVTFDDPLAQVRQALDQGRARELGTAQVDGVPTYKIQFEDKHGYSAQSLVAYVDQHTFRPILLSDPQRNGAVVQLRVVTLEYLAATPANLQLLSLTARHPTARVVTDPGSAKDTPPRGGK
jgi:hypothetical protein